MDFEHHWECDCGSAWLGRGFGFLLTDDSYDWDGIGSIWLGIQFGLDEALWSIQLGLWRIVYNPGLRLSYIWQLDIFMLGSLDVSCDILHCAKPIYISDFSN